jgi:hypothetical protein
VCYIITTLLFALSLSVDSVREIDTCKKWTDIRPMNWHVPHLHDTFIQMVLFFNVLHSCQDSHLLSNCISYMHHRQTTIIIKSTYLALLVSGIWVAVGMKWTKNVQWQHWDVLQNSKLKGIWIWWTRPVSFYLALIEWCWWWGWVWCKNSVGSLDDTNESVFFPAITSSCCTFFLFSRKRLVPRGKSLYFFLPL